MTAIFKEDFTVDNIIAKKYWTKLDGDGVGHLMIELDNGEELEVDLIKGASDMDGTALHDRVDWLLKFNGITVVKDEPIVKPKRKYTRHVDLGLAKDYGKVTLTLAAPIEKFGWVLYLKGTNKYVYRLDKRGIYVMEDNGTNKTPPMVWSDADIKIIKNIDDFDKKKVKTKTNPKNRLA